MPGEFHKEEFTPEEMAVLGETPPEPQKAEPEPAPSETPPKETEAPSAETEPTPEPEPEKPPEQKFKVDGDFIVYEDGERIPVDRFAKVYKQAKDGERLTEKHNLLKQLGRDEYFRLYPDEAPEGWKPKEPERQPEQTAGPVDPFNLVVQGGHYHGMTLGQVWEIDSKEGFRLFNAWKDGQAAEQATKAAQEAAEKEKQGKFEAESERELTAFATERAKELFDKAPDALTDAEKAQVSESISATIKWMKETGRGGGVMADAWFLMNKDSILTKARESAAKGTIDALKKPPVGSIDTGKGTPPESLYGKYAAMTRDQLAREIDGMTTAQTADFLKNAPEPVRRKFPDLFE